MARGTDESGKQVKTINKTEGQSRGKKETQSDARAIARVEKGARNGGEESASEKESSEAEKSYAPQSRVWELSNGAHGRQGKPRG